MTATTEQLLTADQVCNILGIDPPELSAAIKGRYIEVAQRNPDKFRAVALLKGYPRWVSRGRTADECAKYLGIDRRTFTAHLSNGTITRQPNRGYDLSVVTAEHCAHLREACQGQGGAELSDARAAYARIKTQREKMELERERGALVPLAARIDRPLAHCMLVSEALEVLSGHLCAAVGDENHDQVERIISDLWMMLAGSQDAIIQQDAPPLTLKYRVASVLMLLEDGKAAIVDAFPEIAVELDALIKALRAVLKIVAPDYLTDEGNSLADHIRSDIARDIASAKRTFQPMPYRQIPERISGLPELYERARNPTELAKLQAAVIVEDEREDLARFLRMFPVMMRNSAHTRMTKLGNLGKGAIEALANELCRAVIDHLQHHPVGEATDWDEVWRQHELSKRA
jgi:hypothetical protein